MRENLKRQEKRSRSRSRSRSRELRYAHAQSRKGKEKHGVTNKENEDPAATRTPPRRLPTSHNISRPESLRGELPKVAELPEERMEGAGDA